VSEPHSGDVNVSEPHTQNVNVSEPHTRNVNLSDPHTQNVNVSEHHTRNVNISEPHTRNVNVNVETYEDDVHFGRGEEMVECACGCWIHEKCINKVVLDAEGKEKFCSFCVI